MIVSFVFNLNVWQKTIDTEDQAMMCFQQNKVFLLVRKQIFFYYVISFRALSVQCLIRLFLLTVNATW